MLEVVNHWIVFSPCCELRKGSVFCKIAGLLASIYVDREREEETERNRVKYRNSYRLIWLLLTEVETKVIHQIDLVEMKRFHTLTRLYMFSTF